MNKLKRRNFVQEFSLRINRAAVFTDRRLEEKKGYQKHKKVTVNYSVLSPNPLI